MSPADPKAGVVAIRDALAAGDLSRASAAIVDDGFTALSSSIGAELVRLLDRIDRDEIRRFPVVAIVYGLFLIVAPGRRLSGIAQLERAASAAAELSRVATDPAERFVLLGVEACARRFTGGFDEGARAAERMIAMDDAIDETARRRLGGMYAMILGQGSVTAIYAGDSATASRCAERELECSTRNGRPTRVNTALGHAALIAVLDGRYRAADSLLARIRPGDWAEEGWRDGIPSGTATIAAAHAAINRGEFDAALTLLAEFERLDPLGEHWALVAVARAVATAIGGDLEAAEARLAVVLREHSDAAGRSTAHAAGATGLLGIFELITGDFAVGREDASSGRTLVLDLAVRASRAAAAGEIETAATLLARADSRPRVPLQELIVAIVGVTVGLAAKVEPSTLRSFAARIAAVVETHAVYWPLAFLSDEERAAILAAASPGVGASLEACFASQPAIAPRPGRVVRLTARERVVLGLLVETDSRATIAARLIVSENTVKSQLTSLYRKLGVGGRAGALLKAVELGLLGGEQAPRG